MSGDAVLRLRMPIAERLARRPPPGIRIVSFDPADGERVEALLVAVRRDGLAGEAQAQRGWFGRVSGDGEWDPALVVLAEREADGALAGVAHSWSGGFLKDIGVAEAWRRRGLAGALIAESAERLRRRGHAHLDLKVRAANTPALALYASLGFVRLRG